MRTKNEWDAMILQEVKSWENEMIALRRYFHEYPEVSGKEKATSAFLKKEVKKIGLQIEEVPGSTGFIAHFDTEKPGKTLGVRTDIDALPIVENPFNSSHERKIISQNRGVMHACGHDGHMAILLTSMKILASMKAELKGKICFIFEEGEETNTGIGPMVKSLRRKKLDAVYGNHLASFMETGKISIDAGPVMAGALPVQFAVKGKSGHGSRPDLAVNPIFAASQILSGLTNAWANQMDVTKTVTLGITQIHGGSSYNVIPDRVEIDGSLRFFDREEGEKAAGIVRKVAELTAEAHQCRVEFLKPLEMSLAPVVNDSELARRAEKELEEVLPGSLQKGVRWFASETFSAYAKLAPILFAFIGMKNPEYGSGAEHHNDRFDVDEDALQYGAIAMLKFAVSFLLDKQHERKLH